MSTNSTAGRRPTSPADFAALIMAKAPGTPAKAEMQADFGPGFDTTLPPAADPLQPTLRYDLRLEQIKTYDRNPRRTRNPRYDEIKESIRAQGGLNNPITVTRRPDDPLYMVESGGNTRLLILKDLFAETGDERFNRVPVVFRPWQSETHVLSAHLIENELRGDMTLIDKALAVMELKTQFEAEAGETLSRSEWVRRLHRVGLTVSRRQIIVFEYAATVLHPLIPSALQAGLGRHQVERLRKLENASRTYLQSKLAADPRVVDFDELWGEIWSETLGRFDGGDALQIDRFQKDVEGAISEALGLSLQLVRIELDTALKGPQISDEETSDDAGDEKVSAPASEDLPGADADADESSPPPAEPPASIHRPAPPAPTTPVAAATDDDHDEIAAGTADDADIPVYSDTPAAATPATEEPGLDDLLFAVTQAAFNLARRFSLDCYLEFPAPKDAPLRGFGYLVELPNRPLAADEGADSLLRCGIWWVLLTFSGQYDYPAVLDAIAGKPLRITPYMSDLHDGHYAQLIEYVEPACEFFFSGQLPGILELTDDAFEETQSLTRAVRAVTCWLRAHERSLVSLWPEVAS